MKWALAMWLLSCAVSQSAVYYVSTAGSDSADGSVSTPFFSIQKGLNTAVAGDTVLLLSGTYTSNAVSAANGTAASPITIIGSNGPICRSTLTLQHRYHVVKDVRWEYTAVATAGQISFSTTNSIGNQVVSNDWIRIANGINFSGTSPQWTNGSHLNVVRGCTFSNCFDNIMVSYAGYSNTIEQCLFRASNGWDAVRAFGRDHFCRSNYFDAISTVGSNVNHTDIFQTFSSNGEQMIGWYFLNNIVTNSDCQLGNIEDQQETGYISNLVFGCNLFIGGDMQISTWGRRTLFLRNTFWKCSANSAVLYRKTAGRGDASDSRHYGNLHYQCGTDTANVGYGVIGSEGALTGQDFDYCAYLGTSGTKTVYNPNGISTPIDPLFVNGISAPTDLRLQATSPLVGAGMDLSAYGVTRDFAGNLIDGDPDIGALEYVVPSGPAMTLGSGMTLGNGITVR